ncbi:MAG: PDZ domain-containing protein [Rudaea sp.]
MLQKLGLIMAMGASSFASAADTGAVPTTLATVNATATTAVVVQRLREEMHQMLVRLATSGALGAHPEQVALTLDEPAQRAINLGLLVDATSANNARSGLRVLGATPGSTAEHLGVQPGDVIVAVNGQSLRDLGADDSGRALAAATLKSRIDALPDGAPLQLDVLRGGTRLALNAPMQSLRLPALRLGLGSAATASVEQPSGEQGCARISKLDLAPRQKQLYGATILLVDGVTPGPHNTATYRVAAGTHQLLVAERIPTQVMGLGEIASRRNSKPKTLTVTIAPNTTIMIAAHFNEDRATKINDGGYWDPVAWKEVPEACP